MDTENPGFGVLIALVASHWNKIEQDLAIAYTYLLAGEEPSAFEFYHDLIDFGLREKAFLAAAKPRLPADMLSEITKIHAEMRKLSKARNEIIHGTWCSLASKPQSLFLAEPRDVGRKVNEVFDYLRKSVASPRL